MPVYDFVAEDGSERIERVYRIGKAPKIGAFMRWRGKRYRRVPSLTRITVKKSVRHVSKTLPRGWNPDGTPVTPGASSYTPQGEPIIESQADIDRIERENPNFHYGGGIYAD